MGKPGYLALYESGELEERADRAFALLRGCTVCPRECRVDRTLDRKGFCRTGLLPVIASFGPHFGEEPPLVGQRGSGTIFVTHCNLACEFCQNYDISQYGTGREVSSGTLASMMIQLQRQGCHNINIVTPSHIAPQLIRSVGIAARSGLEIPIVYNSGGYDAVETLRLLDGVIDIYMPDAKYGDDTTALALSHAPQYVRVMKAAIREMYRQVGDLVVEDSVAIRGLIVRHLVLPDNRAGSDGILKWIAEEISTDTYVNIMPQYHPAWHTAEVGGIFPDSALNRCITPGEFREVILDAGKYGLHRGF